jgi:hypothetical protein
MPRPDCFTYGNGTQYPFYRWLGGPQGLSGRVRKISLSPVLDAQYRPARRESLYRPPSSADVKKGWSYTSNLSIRLHYLDMDSFTFTCPPEL